MGQAHNDDRQAVRWTMFYIVLVMSAPLMAVLALASITIHQNISRARAVDVQAVVVRASDVASVLVTEIQRERGTSSGFVSSSGVAFGDALRERRIATDAARDAFESLEVVQALLTDQKVANTYPPELLTAITQFRAIIDEFPNMRSRVDRLDVRRDDMMAFYTDAVTQLLMVSDLAALSSGLQQSDRLAVLIALLESSIELAGRERAAGASAFASKQFDQFAVARLQAGQDSLQDRFIRVAPTAMRDRLNAIFESPQGQRLTALRAAYQREDLEVTGPDWFLASTDYIDLLAAFAKDMRAEQLAIIEDRQVALAAEYSRTIVIAVSSFILSVIISVFLSRLLVTPVRELAHNLRRIGNGESNVEVLHTGRRDLVGVVAQSVEQIAARQTERIESVLDLAPIPTCIEDINGTRRRYNRAMLEFLGLDRAHTPGSTTPALSDFLENTTDAEDPGGPNCPERTSTVEAAFHRPDGEVVHGLMTSSILPGVGDDPDSLVTQILDITEMRRLEVVKSNFVSTVSHELRTPITSVRGAIAILKTLRAEQADPREAQLLDIAHRNSERLLVLVNDLLDMDKISRGKVSLKMARYNIGELCETVVNELGPYAEELSVTLACEQGTQNLFARTDSDRFAQILRNLISNAVKFTREGTTVRVDVQGAGDMITIHVRDKGPGIPPEFAPHIFQRFQQADSSASRSHSGSGVGLHISKELTEQLGGTIGFANNPDGGATFWFTVPLMGVARNDGHHPVSTADSDTALPHILHIEDDSSFSDLLKVHLADHARVTNVQSVTEAKSIFRSKEFDLLLIDWELPDGCGLEVLGHGAIAESSTTVIGLSSNGDISHPRALLNILKSEKPLAEICNEIVRCLPVRGPLET